MITYIRHALAAEELHLKPLILKNIASFDLEYILHPFSLR